MDVGMFDIRYTKLFNSHYACDDEQISNMLVEAQADCFETEGRGIEVSSTYADMLKSTSNPNNGQGQIFPILGTGTTPDDFSEAQWVMNRAKGTKKKKQPPGLIFSFTTQE